MSAGERLTLTLTYQDAWCHSSSQLGLEAFESGTERPPHSCPIIPRFRHVSIISIITKPHCVLVIPLLDKEPLSLGYKIFHLSPIASQSLRGFLYARQPTSCPDSSQACWYPPTQSLQSSLALSDVIGSFGFSLCLGLLTVSSQSIELCTLRIFGAILTEGQFSALPNNSQCHCCAT